MPHLVATALAGAALVLPPAEAAAAAGTAGTPGVQAPPPGTPAAAPPTSLHLTLTRPGDGATTARSVTLHCDPPGGTHPEAARACAELARHGGRIEREADRGAACTMIYAPVVAEASGRWRGRPVSFRAEYSNECVLHARTGALFLF